ncbi:hypothetical protein Ahy_B03g063842 [Arachis hypogaea]|uniref:Uncharacterized protein n=1 Tax=Arachis hypogaea TaxID=3818 RepID=A0A444ZY21_ARAHY|nr:hypothetical protein Ahy_B03g063842 [Arachis hypogaea]
MEGLLPMMYRAIKKHTTRRQYQCLSPSARALLDYDFININMPRQETSIHNNNAVLVDDDHHRQRARAENYGSHHHRRYNSTGENFYDRSYSTRGPAADSKQLVRFRSHRKLFSCVTADPI